MKDSKTKHRFLMISKDINTFARAIKRFQKVDKVLFPLIMINAVFTAIQPFIMIFLSGLLIDVLREGKDMKRMLLIAFIGLSAHVIIGIFNCYIGKVRWTKYRNMSGYQGYLLCEKLMEMDFEYIEDVNIQDRVRVQTEYTKSYQGAYYVMFLKLSDCITAFFTVLISIFAVVPMFLKTGRMNTLMEKAINSPFLSLALILFLCGGVLYSVIYSKKVQEIGRENQENMLRINRRFFYLFNNFLDGYEKGKDVRLFHMQNLINKEGLKMGEDLNAYNKKMLRLNWNFEKVNQPISTLTGGFVYLFLGLRAITGAITIGNIVKYAGCILQFIGSFAQLLTSYNALHINNVYLEDFVALLELEPKKQIGTIPVVKRRDNRFIIRCEHVSFRYPGSEDYAIRDLNMTFDIGEKMAVVGKNGSGKTTFIKLLCRLYDPTEGCIYLNDIDIKKYDYDEYLRLFAVVFQDSKIYGFAVGNNISASESYHHDKALDAIHRAGLDELLEKLPDGLDTYVYQHFDQSGIDISGGEAQKMEIARAVYKDAPFVIMDEPTAALDPIAEHNVYSGFNEMVGNKTAIYISHRLSSCRFCNDIVVFDKGQVIQRGNHSELVKEEGMYQLMWNVQAQYYAGTKNEVVFQ